MGSIGNPKTHEHSGGQRMFRQTVGKQKRRKDKKKWEKQDTTSYLLCDKEKL